MSEIKTTLGALLAADAALGRLAQAPLPAKTAYHVAKLRRLAAVEVAHFQEAREALIKELGADREPTPDEAQRNGGQPVTEVLPEHRAAFFARVQELGAVEVTLPWGPLPLDALGDHALTANDIEGLGALITDEIEGT